MSSRTAGMERFDELWVDYIRVAKNAQLPVRGDKEKAWLMMATKAPLALVTLEQNQSQALILIICLLNIMFDDLPDTAISLHELFEYELNPERNSTSITPTIPPAYTDYAQFIANVLDECLPNPCGSKAQQAKRVQNELYQAYMHRHLNVDTQSDQVDEWAGKGMIAGVFIPLCSEDFLSLKEDIKEKLIFNINMIGRIGNDIATGEREIKEQSYTWLTKKIPLTEGTEFTNYLRNNKNQICSLLRIYVTALKNLQLDESFFTKLKNYCIILWTSEIKRLPDNIQSNFTHMLNEIFESKN